VSATKSTFAASDLSAAAARASLLEGIFASTLGAGDVVATTSPDTFEILLGSSSAEADARAQRLVRRLLDAGFAHTLTAVERAAS
jgi:hypothetical protein